MKFKIKPYLRLELARKYAMAVTLGWAGVASAIAIRNRPEILLIGIDENGTRLIQSQADPLLAREKVKFIKEFLFRFYNYNSDDYEKLVSLAGNLMADPLWLEKEKELKRIAAQMKETKVEQSARILDLREMGDQEYEADLAIRVQTKLLDREVKYRISIKIGSRKRNADNPYPWEVVELHEIEIK